MNEVHRVARGAAWILLAGTIVRGLEAGFDERPLLALGFGAFTVDFLAQRTGLRWLEDDAKPRPPYRLAVRGIGVGVALGLGVILATRLLGVARIGPGSPTLLVAISAIRPLLQAMRDELLFRGMPLTIAKGRFPDRLAIPFAALLGAAPLVSTPGLRPEALLLAISSGLFFGLLWRLGRGGFLAWGAHAGWLLTVDAASRGTLLDVSFSTGALAPLARASGWPAYVATALFLLAALLVSRSREGREQA